MVNADGSLALTRVGGRLALSLHSSNEPDELSQLLAMMTAPYLSSGYY